MYKFFCSKIATPFPHVITIDSHWKTKNTNKYAPIPWKLVEMPTAVCIINILLIFKCEKPSQICIYWMEYFWHKLLQISFSDGNFISNFILFRFPRYFLDALNVGFQQLKIVYWWFFLLRLLTSPFPVSSIKCKICKIICLFLFL